MEQPVVSINNEKGAADASVSSSSRAEALANTDEGLINASGHREQLERNFNLVSICSYAITAGNTWVSLGGGIVRIPLPLQTSPFLTGLLL